MNRKQYCLTVLLSLVAGLIGGVVSTQFFISQPVFAEKTEQPTKVIVAEEFRLIDKNGKIVATLGMGVRSSPELRILTPAYDNRTGVLISADNNGADISLFGPKTDISMRVMSTPAKFSPAFEEAELKISRGFDDDSSVSLKIGKAGEAISGPKLELTDSKGKTRAVLGRVSLEVTATGETRERPESSLALFGRDGKTIWSAP